MQVRQTISFIEISIEAGILLGGKHEACFVLGVAGIGKLFKLEECEVFIRI
jgi:hypothetical protein